MKHTETHPCVSFMPLLDMIYASEYCVRGYRVSRIQNETGKEETWLGVYLS